MNEKQFAIKLSRFITEEKNGVSAYAKELGVSKSLVSDIKRGSKPPTKAILEDMGFERIKKVTVKYQKVEN